MTRSDLNGLAVLAVEDNRVMRGILVRALSALGAREVREACHGGEAIAALASFAPDLVITDWSMAPVDGLALTYHIRRSTCDCRRAVPVIMITAHAEKWREEVARDAGVDAILFKPLRAGRLRQCALEVLNVPRAFITTPAYIGPDRRRGLGSYVGPERRRSPEQ